MSNPCPIQTFAAIGLVETLAAARHEWRDFGTEHLQGLIDHATACDYALNRLGHWDHSEVLREEILDHIVALRLDAGI